MGVCIIRRERERRGEAPNGTIRTAGSSDCRQQQHLQRLQHQQQKQQLLMLLVLQWQQERQDIIFKIDIENAAAAG